ncbi:MAG: DUF4350 domain-containing protein [Planctomycetota bacterium]
MPLLLAAVQVTNAFAQEGRVAGAGTSANVDWQFRHELFQMLLEERGLAAVETLDAALASPQESVIVMIGKLNRFQVADSSKLVPFVAQGGTVLVAADRSGTMGLIASFASGPITSVDAATRYQDLPDCLRVTDLDQTHPLTQGIHEIIINRSGWLVLLPSSPMTWDVVATVPQTCSPRRCREQPLIAVSQSSPSEVGTMIVAADPSLFTNSMMWHGDNAVLAIRVSELLCRGGKNRLAFVVEGQPQPSYRASPLLQETNTPSPQNTSPPPMPPRHQPPPKPTLEMALRVANSVIQNVEESNILNEAIINHPRYPNRWLYPRVVLLSLAAITAAWLFSKLAHTAAVRPPPPSIRDMQSAHGLSKEGTDASRDYGAAAQTLARELCRELSMGSQLPAEWPHCPTAPSMLPSWETMKKSQRRDLATVVELAASRDTPHISPRRLRQVGTIIRTLRTLHRESLLVAASPMNVSQPD